MEQSSNRALILWLAVCALMVFSMVVLGGAVRVTGSGLSMVDWNPVMGILPPLDHAAWTRAFEQYQQFPEYKIINQGMSLDGFKFIFLMEYAHRILGRMIGLVFFLPFLYFLAKGRVGARLAPHLWGLFVLGAIQGGIGWYMVKSGLVDNPHVSQYRLTLHLMIAILIYAWMMRLIGGLCPVVRRSRPVARKWGLLALVVVLLMIASGGFVAGTRAGYIYNTFPTMGGEWIPAQVAALDPLWRNFFENPVAVQLVHRALAMVVLCAVCAYAFLLVKVKETDSDQANWFGYGLFVAAGLQVALGILTLVNAVPPVLAVMHQGGALVLLGLLVLSQAPGLQQFDVREGRDLPGGQSRQFA